MKEGNLTIVPGKGTKSFLEVSSRKYPEHGGFRQEAWVEGEQGQELDYRLRAIGLLAAAQFADENPDRHVHVVNYTLDH